MHVLGQIMPASHCIKLLDIAAAALLTEAVVIGNMNMLECWAEAP